MDKFTNGTEYNNQFTQEELNNEVWKDVGECKGYEEYKGLYKVSNLGRVKNNKCMVKSLNINHRGYYSVKLYSKGKSKNARINRLVALAFLPNPEDLPVVNHKDENKLNNRVNNLEWCTVKYNNNYGTTKERRSKPVIMYDKQDNKLREFNSVIDANQYLGKRKHSSNINKCCNGKHKTAYGYKWKYK